MDRSEEDVYRILSEMLLSAALPAGQRLGERDLAEVLNVSRERVRKVLQRLGAERLVTLIPNRGAFVATPSLESGRRIYDARRVLEAGLLLVLAQTINAAQIDELRAHLVKEHDAAQRGDRACAVQLSGAFHLKLAAMTNNDFVTRYMQELVSRTSMLVAFFEGGAPACGIHEHEDIVEALSRHDGPRAALLGATHLSLIETRLKMQTDCSPVQIDLLELVRARLKTLDGHPNGSVATRAYPQKSNIFQPG